MEEKYHYENYIILHGCPPSKDKVTPRENRWMFWLEQALIDQGLRAEAPEMPTSWNPKYADWKEKFAEYLVTENTMLIGHSCGAAFLIRWLLENERHVHKLVLVAPAKVPETMPDGKPDPREDLYNFDLPSDASMIADEIVVFTSNDFPHHLQSLEIYIRALNPRVERLENKGHFLPFQMGTNKFPELLEEVLK